MCKDGDKGQLYVNLVGHIAKHQDAANMSFGLS
jgi:hypothetical protein